MNFVFMKRKTKERGGLNVIIVKTQSPFYAMTNGKAIDYQILF